MLRCGIYWADGSPVVSARAREVIFPVHDAEELPPHAFQLLLTDALLSCRRRLRTPIFPLATGVAWPSRVASATGDPQPLALRRSWTHVSVKQLIADALRAAGLPGAVRIVNDADAEAVAESRLGVVKDAHTALVVKIAGGLGAAVLHQGSVLSGARGFAGEIGHVPARSIVRDAGLPAVDLLRTCSCGEQGHLQTIVSIAAAVDRLAPGLAARRGSYLAAIEHIEHTVSAAKIDAVMHEMGVVLGRALCTPVAMLNADMVVLRPSSFPSSRLVSGVLDELRAALIDVPAVRLGSHTEVGQWMGAQGAALAVSDEFARPRVRSAQADWRSVPRLPEIPPLPTRSNALSRV